jgi:DNA-binding NtrC family response regulator
MLSDAHIATATPPSGVPCLIAPGILGRSTAIEQLRRRLPKVAQAERTTLITGPTGSGKELVARALHLQSARAQAPFIAVNCGALPESLVESELFGHCRGAFTGATGVRTGLVPSAHGGTLFLDEVNSLPPPAQATLLRFLENGEFRPVGADKVQHADTWVITATNENLHQRVEQGTFRLDLMYRLGVITLTVPPLVARDDDVLVLAEHFLEETGVPGRRFSVRAREALKQHDWPGNIRELKHRVLNAALFSEQAEIDAEDLGLRDRPLAALSQSASDLPDQLWSLIESGMSLEQAIGHCERHLILGALRAEENNRTRAATRLGIHVRTIFKKLAGEEG